MKSLWIKRRGFYEMPIDGFDEKHGYNKKLIQSSNIQGSFETLITRVACV